MQQGKKGFFTKEAAGYQINDRKVRGDWEYIYQNRDILLKTDQFGVVVVQANPVNDIFLLRRDGSEKYSKWRVWVRKDEGTYVSNFAYPNTVEPKDGYIRFLPEKAEYYYEFEGFTVKTEIFIPRKNSLVIATTTVKNTGKNRAKFDVLPTMLAYANGTDYDIWDKAEWYNNTSVAKDGDLTAFYTKRLSPSAKKEERRLVVCLFDKMQKVDIRAAAFLGNGTFDLPDGLHDENWLFHHCDLPSGFDFPENSSLGGLPFIYAAKASVEIDAGKEESFTQILSMQDKAYCGEFEREQYEGIKKYFLAEEREKEIAAVKEHYASIFESRKIQTGDEAFDKFVNEFLPLQLTWVASLDRGWPTGLRGTRDAANDFMGVAYYDEKWAREVLLTLYSNQQVNGWLPRQVASVEGSKKVDLRPYSDSGAFLMEFLHEYVRLTGDISVLNEKIGWLDGEETDSLLEHLLRSVEHYLLPENIGEHGLCKIYGGDWLDALNNAGLRGRGESVMVTCQVAMGLRDTADLLNFLRIEPERAKEYRRRAAELTESVSSAYNEKGFYNGAFTDEGRWVFSDCDEDGECRPYGPANYYALCSGAAKGNEERVLAALEKLRTPIGYKLCDPAMGRKPMKCAGRMGSGDQQIGMWENGNVYNHAQGFRIRALASVGKGDELFETLTFLLPYDETIHDPNVTLSPPYAMLNCYQSQPLYDGMAGSPFLTGSIAMAERAVYRWMLGIVPELDELKICPCLKKGKTDIRTNFSLRGKKIEIRYTGENTGEKPSLRLNGKPVDRLSYAEMNDGAKIEVLLR